MPPSPIGQRIAAWPKWTKIILLIIFLGFVTLRTIPLIASYIDLRKDGSPSGYVTETSQTGIKRKWTVQPGQVPNNQLTYILTSGEEQTILTVYPEFKYFSFYRTPEGYILFQGIRCPIIGGRLSYLPPSSKSRVNNPMSWNGAIEFNCPATTETAGIEGAINLR